MILGVGLTIGSVPPDDETNCVRNITYRRITQTSPIKGIYVKVRGDAADLSEHSKVPRAAWAAATCGSPLCLCFDCCRCSRTRATTATASSTA